MLHYEALIMARMFTVGSILSTGTVNGRMRVLDEEYCLILTMKVILKIIVKIEWLFS